MEKQVNNTEQYDEQEERILKHMAQERDDIQALADKYSLGRVKIEGEFFDRDYKRQKDGQMHLSGQKAVIKVFGKITKTPISTTTPHKDYTQAYEVAKERWGEYYKQRRLAEKTPAARAGERRRQKAYRKRQKEERGDIRERQ